MYHSDLQSSSFLGQPMGAKVVPGNKLEIHENEGLGLGAYWILKI